MISHKHKTIFVHIPKCAGTSIEMMFLKNLGLDYEQRAPLLLRPNDREDLGPPRLAHLTAEEYIKYHYISDSLFNDYYSFSIVRNPIARTLSFYNYLGYSRTMPVSQFVQRELVSIFESQAGMYWFMRPQVSYIYDKDDQLLVDSLYRLEEINSHMDEILRRANLTNSTFEHDNKSSHQTLRHRLRQTVKLFLQGSFSLNPVFSRARDFSESDIHTLQHLYKRDFDLLGYKAK
jgi:hypothetical protein